LEVPMTDDGQDEAARAFDDLRAEVSLMRRVVERLAAERADDGPAPDYSETLGVISQNLSATAQRVDALVKSPALSLTPEETGRQIGAAGFDARREDHRLLVAARQGLDEVAARLGHQLHSHTEAGEQQRRMWRVGLAAVVVGMAIWAIFAGPIARILPKSWLLPERMAARSLRMPMWEGGQRLMRAGDPQAFASVLVGNRLMLTNHETLDTCRAQSAKAKKPVRCVIQVEAAK
jgi:hypothetical protein